MTIVARRRTDHIIIHCSATKPEQDVGAAEIDKWHRQKGWLKIGYHYVIKRDGTIEIGRKHEQVGAHCQGKNHNSVGICLVGGSDADDLTKAEANFTEDQMEALDSLLYTVRGFYPNADVIGHRDVDPHKACPSFDVAHWLKTNEVKA